MEKQKKYFFTKGGISILVSIRDQAIEKVKTTSGNYSVGLNFASPLLKNNFIRSWRILRYDMNSCDVTLACVDGEIGAHKVILSSVSPVFKRLLSKKFYKHPYLYLRGMRYSQILAFLDYIYLGEVSVDKQNIDKFIDIIKEFIRPPSLKIIFGIIEHSTTRRSPFTPQNQPLNSLQSF